MGENFLKLSLKSAIMGPEVCSGFSQGYPVRHCKLHHGFGWSPRGGLMGFEE